MTRVGVFCRARVPKFRSAEAVQRVPEFRVLFIDVLLNRLDAAPHAPGILSYGRVYVKR